MTTTKTTTATCRATTTAHGVRMQCDRPQGHPGQHQIHFPRSRVVLTSWARKR
ncbi:hypothetical protein ACFROC_18045 [Nocardia tengchongensis]|uniref:hypothetical protein n=1 Tax=Nocardia tengchongensis TaxID=2055889 RepID=UPI0036823767